MTQHDRLTKKEATSILGTV